MPTPKIIHQIHLGPEMSEQIKAWAETFKILHTSWEYFLWDESMMAKHGLNLESLKDKFKSWAGVSNYVRLFAVYNFGGFYADTDCQCLKPLDALLTHDACAAFQDSERICNACFSAKRHHSWIKWQLDNAFTEMDGDPATGVYAMTKAPRNGLTVVPTEYFYPFPWDCKPDQRKAHPDSFLIHHWKGSWL